MKYKMQQVLTGKGKLGTGMKKAGIYWLTFHIMIKMGEMEFGSGNFKNIFH